MNWEYRFVKMRAHDLEDLIGLFGDLGIVGWELVGFSPEISGWLGPYALFKRPVPDVAPDKRYRKARVISEPEDPSAS